MVGANTTSVYPCRSCEIPRAHVRANTEKMQSMRDCHLVGRTCDNEVGVKLVFVTYIHRRSRAGANEPRGVDLALWSHRWCQKVLCGVKSEFVGAR